ncbi:MAG: sugar phosphate isomerase/epimerase, partial [Armatimonadetes bacterium]|nr:sugar phosphate isomerase/epimerase [Armatimonadota bacterium]
HLHWCNQWNTDFLYTAPELDQISAWLRKFGLQLNDIHASAGREKSWSSPREYERLAGVELVKNRMDMAARLGSDVIIMHFPSEPKEKAEAEAFWDRMRRTLDELQAHSRARGVRLAVENLDARSFPTLAKIFDAYGSGFAGLCYDSGHANLGGQDGPASLDPWKHRLIALHLHDNDGTGDQHKLPFTGTVDWKRLVPLLAASSYTKPISLEVVIGNTGIPDEREFLYKAFEAGTAISKGVETSRRGQT